MREFIAEQRPLVAGPIDHQHAAELERMSELLDQLKGAPRRITQDLQRDVVHKHRGRRGLSGEQVLRILVLKLLTQLSYARLEFLLADSSSYRRFCRLGIAGETPRASTLQANIKRIRPETVEWIHRRLLHQATKLGVEDGECALVDSTAFETNIHHPNDSFLLSRGVKVLSRLLRRSQQFVEVAFSDHTRRAKRRAQGISNAKRMSAREPLYRDLVKVTMKSLGYARRTAEALANCGEPAAVKLSLRLASTVGLVAQVVDQTQRRVFNDESVPASEKIVSLHEPHTDILQKGGRETVYGHKLFLSRGHSGLVTDLVVERGNPTDASRTLRMVARHSQLFGSPPRKAAFDAGFATTVHQKTLMERGVEEVAFAKNSGFDVLQSVSDPKVHRTLMRARAGVEATISWLKRCFGLRRCPWSGFASFKAYAWSAVLTANLLHLARTTMT